MAKRITFTASPKIENTALEANLDESLVELQLKPPVIHRGVEVYDTVHHFSNSGDSDTRWGTVLPSKPS